MEVLINHLETALKVYTHQKAKHFHACINNAWVKLCEYYQLLDASPVYAASLVLNPAIKERHFDRNWRGGLEAWVPKTKEDIRDFWIKDKVAPNPALEIFNRDYDELENYM